MQWRDNPLHRLWLFASNTINPSDREDSVSACINEQSLCLSRVWHACGRRQIELGSVVSQKAVAGAHTRIDTPISEYLPSFNPSGDPEIGKSANVVDALSHATGLKDVSSLYLGVDGSTLFSNGERTIRTINNLPVAQGEFRKVWRYNGLMYGLIGLVIEKVAGMTYHEFLESRILTPLGLHGTCTIFSDRAKEILQQGQLATPYIILTDGSVKDISVSEYGHGTPLAIGCGLQSSVEDLLKWSAAIIDSYRSIHGLETHNSTSHPTLREMQKILSPACTLPTSIGGVASYCLGWFLMKGQFIFDDIFDQMMERAMPARAEDLGYPAVARDQPERAILFHSGLFHGFSSTIHLYPETCDAVIVLGNSTGRGDAVDWISRLVTAIVCGDEPSPNIENLLRIEGEGQQRVWDIMEKEWSSRRNQGEPAEETPRCIDGTYRNEALAMDIRIFSVNTDSHVEEPFLSPRLFVSFHQDRSHRLLLRHYHDNIYSFFPSKAAFQERLMWHFPDYTQFLLHMDYEGSKDGALGLWWQYERSSDGIWFGIVEDDG